MRRFILALAVAWLVLWAPRLHAAGTLTCTAADEGRSHVRYSCAWTSTAGGAVSGNGFAVSGGWLESVRFAPGTTTPTDLYDVTITHSDGSFSTGDLLAGTGADLSNTTAKLLTFDPLIWHDGRGTFDIVVANAGNAKTGTVVLYVRTQ
jgi:hypothetical protein